MLCVVRTLLKIVVRKGLLMIGNESSAAYPCKRVRGHALVGVEALIAVVRQPRARGVLLQPDLLKGGGREEENREGAYEYGWKRDPRDESKGPVMRGRE